MKVSRLGGWLRHPSAAAALGTPLAPAATGVRMRLSFHSVSMAPGSNFVRRRFSLSEATRGCAIIGPRFERFPSQGEKQWLMRRHSSAWFCKLMISIEHRTFMQSYWTIQEEESRAPHVTTSIVGQ